MQAAFGDIDDGAGGAPQVGEQPPIPVRAGGGVAGDRQAAHGARRATVMRGELAGGAQAIILGALLIIEVRAVVVDLG
ncbi:MAG: hypothetical protein WCI67_15405, partial [Chloroflexales bacterium]